MVGGKIGENFRDGLLRSVPRYARLRTKTTVPSETQHGMCAFFFLASKGIDREFQDGSMSLVRFMFLSQALLKMN